MVRKRAYPIHAEEAGLTTGLFYFIKYDLEVMNVFLSLLFSDTYRAYYAVSYD